MENFKNKLNENVASLENLMDSYVLKDKYGHPWEIIKIDIEKKAVVLRLGNEGTENYSAIVLLEDDDRVQMYKDYEFIKK